jgi:hypothetical protein
LKKWPKEVKGFVIPIYGQELYLAKSLESFNKCAAYLSDTTEYPPCGGLCAMYQADTGQIINLIGVFDGNVSTLVHELSHCAFNVLESVGVPVLPGDPNEAFAYLIGELFEQSALLLK